MAETLIPVNAQVECVDGKCGEVVTVVIDPVRQVLTHIVVKTGKGHDYLVPLASLDKTEDETVHLNCTVAELEAMPAFTETQFIKTEHPAYNAYPSGIYQSPYATGYETLPDEEYVSVEEEKVPAGELAFHRGAKVTATDGSVGELEEFIIDAESGAVTHFVLRRGHLWGKKDISIPISAVDYVEGDTVHLNLDKHDVAGLPTIQIKHHYHG